MGILQDFANAQEVNEALKKGIQGYDKAVKNETDILSVSEDLSKHDVVYQINYLKNEILVDEKPVFVGTNREYHDGFQNGDTAYLIAKITGDISDVETNVRLRTKLGSKPWTTTNSYVKHLFDDYYFAECVCEQLDGNGYITITNASESTAIVERVVLSKEGYTYPDLSFTHIVNDVYTVGIGRDFTTFTECIRALKDVETPKTILIDGGRYNLFEEIGGSTYTQSIQSGTAWKDCNDIIPPNTTIKGLGTVIFEFKPTAEEIGEVAMGLISPLNIRNGDVRIENIIVDALNCRYAIHDDGSSVDTNSVHEYVNVKAKKRSGGFGQACGFGIGKNCNFIFRDCVIDSNVTCFTIHNQSFAYSGSILFDGVVSRCSGANAVGFRSLSSQTDEHYIEVKLVNCFVTENSKVYLRRETSGSSATNPYLVTVVKCSNVDDIDTSDYTDLQLAPIIYS